MVCLGNICRSPLAEGILRNLVQAEGLDWEVDSAGTSSWHVGSPPDPRSIKVAADRDIDIRNQVSRQFVVEDFDRFDLILAMDEQNYADIISLSRRPELDSRKLRLLLDYCSSCTRRSVPDPYYEGGFEGVFDLIQAACMDLVQKEKGV